MAIFDIPKGANAFSIQTFTANSVDQNTQGTCSAANGTVSVNNETGDITYTPNPGFAGTDTITYTAVDEGGLTYMMTHQSTDALRVNAA